MSPWPRPTPSSDIRLEPATAKKTNESTTLEHATCHRNATCEATDG